MAKKKSAARASRAKPGTGRSRVTGAARRSTTAKSGTTKSGSTKPGPTKPGTTKPGPTKSGGTKSGPKRPGAAWTRQPQPAAPSLRESVHGSMLEALRGVEITHAAFAAAAKRVVSSIGAKLESMTPRVQIRSAREIYAGCRDALYDLMGVKPASGATPDGAAPRHGSTKHEDERAEEWARPYLRALAGAVRDAVATRVTRAVLDSLERSWRTPAPPPHDTWDPPYRPSAPEPRQPAASSRRATPNAQPAEDASSDDSAEPAARARQAVASAARSLRAAAEAVIEAARERLKQSTRPRTPPNP